MGRRLWKHSLKPIAKASKSSMGFEYDLPFGIHLDSGCELFVSGRGTIMTCSIVAPYFSEEVDWSCSQ